jgi:hypothetical protein
MNITHSIDEVNTVEVDPDLQNLVDQMVAGKTDPALLLRVRQAAEMACRDIQEKHGVRNIALELVHEARDGG